MDSLVSAAARALRAGDPLGALKRVALREDAPALALRGIAMAQLGELAKAKPLLRRAARAFGPRESVARARCLTAEAEVALAARDLGWPARALDEALRTFAAHGDRENELYARLLQTRRLLLLGQMAGAELALSRIDLRTAPALLVAIAELVSFEIGLRRVDTRSARAALERARHAAERANIPSLSAEVEQAMGLLAIPAARLIARGEERSILLEEVEAVLASKNLVVDACRRAARSGRQVIALARRPVLFALLRALAEAWPGETARELLIWRAFGARRGNASHRARLRVELGRLRKALRGLGEVRATPHGFLLAPRRPDEEVLVLAPPIEGADADVLALLADGEAWSTSALALALGSSQRTVQRALSALEEAGKVRGLGRGRTKRWLSPPVSGFTTTLLLPAFPALG
ncbi:MAG: helix-turn-helix transcriptional regulator [Deltaproteobacteria bacterium]|nr:MAG: helix-turn-helix transcriptional regulator [Deltaproteobacteria bacterium]